MVAILNKLDSKATVVGVTRNIFSNVKINGFNVHFNWSVRKKYY